MVSIAIAVAIGTHGQLLDVTILLMLTSIQMVDGRLWNAFKYSESQWLLEVVVLSYLVYIYDYVGWWNVIVCQQRRNKHLFDIPKWNLPKPKYLKNHISFSITFIIKGSQLTNLHVCMHICKIEIKNGTELKIVNDNR